MEVQIRKTVDGKYNVKVTLGYGSMNGLTQYVRTRTDLPIILEGEKVAVSFELEKNATIEDLFKVQSEYRDKLTEALDRFRPEFEAVQMAARKAIEPLMNELREVWDRIYQLERSQGGVDEQV